MQQVYDLEGALDAVRYYADDMIEDVQSQLDAANALIEEYEESIERYEEEINQLHEELKDAHEELNIMEVERSEIVKPYLSGGEPLH
jgi:chromosome segregation ATPase